MRRRDTIIRKVNNCKNFKEIISINVKDMKFNNDGDVILEPILYSGGKPSDPDEIIGIEISHYDKRGEYRKSEKFYFSVPEKIRYGDRYLDWGWE